MTDAAPILDRLEKVRVTPGGWLALCPAHGDHTPSLKVSEAQDRILLHCFSGCSPESIVEALGMSMSDLFDKKRDPLPPPRSIVYVIRDENNRIVAFHERRPTPDGGKTPVWRRRSGELGLDGRRVASLPLYGSQHVKNWDTSRPIFITEGEKDATALLRAGFRALGTVTGAAGTPSAEVLGILKGHHVILWADNDQVGRDHMRRITRLLRPIAAGLAEFEWKEGPKGGGAHDYLELSGNNEELQNIYERAEQNTNN